MDYDSMVLIPMHSTVWTNANTAYQTCGSELRYVSISTWLDTQGMPGVVTGWAPAGSDGSRGGWNITAPESSYLIMCLKYGH